MLDKIFTSGINSTFTAIMFIEGVPLIFLKDASYYLQNRSTYYDYLTIPVDIEVVNSFFENTPPIEGFSTPIESVYDIDQNRLGLYITHNSNIRELCYKKLS